jgi:hypothetical protein
VLLGTVLLASALPVAAQEQTEEDLALREDAWTHLVVTLRNGQKVTFTRGEVVKVQYVTQSGAGAGPVGTGAIEWTGTWKCVGGTPAPVDLTAVITFNGNQMVQEQQHAHNNRPATSIFTIATRAPRKLSGSYVHRNVAGSFSGTWRAEPLANGDIKVYWHDNASGQNGENVFRRAR